MRIYAFAEHYPNTYKPYYDAQFAQFLEDGHELRIFAFGKFDATRNAAVARYGLDRRTAYLPSTVRTVPPFAAALLRQLVERPRGFAHGLAVGWDSEASAKRSLLDAARTILLPEAPPDLCLIHNLVTAQSFGFLPQLYPQARIALYFHGGEIPNGGTITADEAHRVFYWVDRVFTNTAYSRDEAVRRGCPPDKLVVNPVGFRIADYRPPAPKAYRRGGVLRLLTVGRASVEKGLDDAVTAARLLKARGVLNFRLRMVGTGPRLAALRARIRAERLSEHVESCGELPHHALAEEYRAADALLLPSVAAEHWQENQACVVQEAMLMKLLVIASRTGGVQESLAPCLRRFSVEPHDPRGIVERVEELLEVSDEEMSGLAEEGRAFAERGYDIRRLNAQLLAEAMARPQAERPSASGASTEPLREVRAEEEGAAG